MNANLSSFIYLACFYAMQAKLGAKIVTKVISEVDVADFFYKPDADSHLLPTAKDLRYRNIPSQ